MICQKCGSEHVIKNGFTKSRGQQVKRQVFKCKDCGYKILGKKTFFKKQPFVYKSKPVPSQDWSSYTLAQNQHKKGLMNLMKEMLELIEIKQAKIGRPTHNLKDITFALALKTFTRLSSRRLHSELEFAKQLGYIEQVPHFTITMKHLASKEMTLILRELLKLSALPIRETSSKTYSVDATGFSTSMFGRWFDHKYGTEKVKREWLKCHAMIENKTNVVVNATITEGHAADSPRFEKLVTETNQRFEIKEVAADAAYISKKNLEIVTRIGAKPFIPFKSNANPRRNIGNIWNKMYWFFKNKPQEFFEGYHKRSNVETSFSMIKMKLDSNLRTKTFIGQQNEILLRLIVHNCLCLIHEYYERNINRYFDTQTQKVLIPLK